MQPMQIQNSQQGQNHSSRSSTASLSDHPFLQSFKQQMLKAWLPIPSLSKTIFLFFLMSLIFLGIGIPMFILSNNIVDVTVNYDSCAAGATNCTLQLIVPQVMEAPVFVYYELDNFYQNHRLYANSISYKQLGGQTITVSQAQTSCNPIVTNGDLWVTTSITGATLNSSAPANPCGMVAYTIFNDTFTLIYPSGSTVAMSTENIAWPSDYSQFAVSNREQMWIDVTDPRFMNWVRISPLPTFRKVWARINSNLEPGTYTLQVNNTYTVSQFNTQKSFVLSTSNFFGARNQFLSIIYLVMGCLCFVIAVCFCIKKIKKDRKKTIHAE